MYNCKLKRYLMIFMLLISVENYYACWLWQRDPCFGDQVLDETSLHLLLGAQDLMSGLSAPWAYRNLLWQLSRDGNLHGSGMLHTETDSPKSSLGCLGGWAMMWLAQELLGWTEWGRMNNPIHARTAHNGFPQKRPEEDLCWIVPHVPHTLHDPTGQRTQLFLVKRVVSSQWCMVCPSLTH